MTDTNGPEGGRIFYLIREKSQAFSGVNVHCRQRAGLSTVWITAGAAERPPAIALIASVYGLAGSTGLEPAASAVTGLRSSQLNYDPKPETGIGDLGDCANW